MKGKATTVMVFGADGHPFMGTELLIHKSVYNGQLCVTDHGGPYDEVLPGVMACHHFETGHH
ncbi:MAG: hypothetical protein R3300_20240 [Candidatus Promineifilaceae bacterium]|nr:hypothetical protein [Candidatus Promineifilaceae bacterium]